MQLPVDGVIAPGIIIMLSIGLGMTELSIQTRENKPYVYVNKCYIE